MNTLRLTILLLGCGLLAACDQEPPPRSVQEFVDNPLLLEAAVVRCAEDRAGSRYVAECVNAREAVSRVEAAEEAAGRQAREARSDEKRRALRRTQEAAAEARRRAAEAEKARREAEYLAQFGEVPAEPGVATQADDLTGNAPTAVIPDSAAADISPDYRDSSAPAVDGGNAPGAVTEAVEQPADLDSIRDELRRRNEESSN
jgi:hypothetical protein